MELSKNEVIFTILDKHIESIEEDDGGNYIKINILNNNSSWTENEFNNFTSKFPQTRRYTKYHLPTIRTHKHR